MKRPRHILLNAATVLSILLCAAIIVLWVLSRAVAFDVIYGNQWAETPTYRMWMGEICHGTLSLKYTKIDIEPVEGWREAAVAWGTGIINKPGWTMRTVAVWPASKAEMLLGQFGASADQPWNLSLERKVVFVNSGFGASVPCWTVLLASLTLPMIRLRKAVRSHRRARNNHCPKCGYDLRATPDRCPECGTINSSPGTSRAPATTLRP